MSYAFVYQKNCKSKITRCSITEIYFVAQDIMFNALALLSLESLILIRELVEQDSSLVYN